MPSVQKRMRAARLRVIALVVLCALVILLPSAMAQSDESSSSAPIVRSVVVQGNVEVSTDQILEQVESTVVGRQLERPKVQEDVQRIADLGFFENVEAIPSTTSDGVMVTFVVQEFPVVQAFEVTVKDDVVPAEEVKELIGVTEGEILNAKQFGEALDRLPVQSGEVLGYVLRTTAVDFRGANGDELHLEVTPVRVRSVRIEGNEKTNDVVILREFPIEEGEILSMDEVRTGLRKLGQLGYFEPIVPEFLTTSDPLMVDVLLPVVEAKTGRAAFGGGYSSADGLIGYIEVADDNFLGRGERARVKWEFGRNKNTYDLGFEEPYLFGTTTSAGINLYNMSNRRQQYEGGTAYPFTEKRIGGDITFGRPLGPFTRGFLTLKAENSSVTPESTGSVVSPSENRTRSVIANTRTDTTDHLYFPTLGFRHNMSVEAAGRFLGGDTEFTKLQTSFSKFVKAGRNDQTWAFRMMAGYGMGTLPLQDQFRVGGADTVRGYSYGEMSGDRMAVVQGEYRFPINDNIQGVVFADAGNAWNQSGIDLSDLKVGAGVGVRFGTPLGIIRIDYGIGENGGNAYFSLGPSF